MKSRWFLLRPRQQTNEQMLMRLDDKMVIMMIIFTMLMIKKKKEKKMMTMMMMLTLIVVLVLVVMMMMMMMKMMIMSMIVMMVLIFARCWCSCWRWRWSWRSMVCHDGTYSQNIFYCSSKILSLKTWLRRPVFSSYNIVTSISSSSKRHPLNCVIAGLAMFLGRSSASFFLRKTWVGNFPPLSVRKIELKWLSTKPSLCLIMLGKEVIQHYCWEMRSSSVLLAKLDHLRDEPWIFRRKDEQRSQ